MNRSKTVLLALFMGIVSLFSVSAKAADKPITLSLPESVIATTIRAVLPLQINNRASNLKGDITIVEIGDLQISDGGLSAHIRLDGKNMALTTNIGGRDLNLNIGSVNLDVLADATLRFDPQKQILYIRPTVRNSGASNDSQASQVGSLISLLNGQEFPIGLQSLQPFVSQFGNKQVVINTRIVNVQPHRDMLELQLAPTVSTRGIKGKK